MEFLVQNSLPYILQTMVCAHTTTNLSQSIYAFHKANMLLLYYIMLLILKSSTFFFVLCDCVICDSNMCHNSVTHDITSYLLSISKIKKSENKN